MPRVGGGQPEGGLGDVDRRGDVEGRAGAHRDTIVAAATPPGRGGIGIVRVSGELVPAIASALLGGLPEPRRAIRGDFTDGDGALIDSGLALYFPTPNSYTGEPVLELHGHGSPVVIEALIRRVLECGARRALPGEFTQRAYLNGKLDLAQAEAVADLIDAGSEAAARAAARSLQGEFSARVHQLADSIAQLRVLVEAAIDFADEQLDVLSDRALRERLADVQQQFAALTRATRQGRLLAEGLTVVIAGRPNVGKSSLMNRLAGHETAIVTPIAGTTRDLLRERIDLDGLPLHLIDTAGLRSIDEAAGDAGAQQLIEAEGIRRAQAQMAVADRVLFVIDAVDDPQAQALTEQLAHLPAGVSLTVILNKVDLLEASFASALPATQGAQSLGAQVIPISALTGAGLDLLREHLKDSVGYQSDAGQGAGSEGGTLSARGRHVEALARSKAHVDEGVRQLERRSACELVAEELRLAQQALGAISGDADTEELLGRIFASFCIGK